MKFIGTIILIALLLLGVFLFVNWGALSTPSQISLLFFDAEFPFGLILLGVILALTVLFTSYVLVLRTTMLMEAHRHAQELEAQRKLAENAESSRFDQLREQITLEFTRTHTANQDTRTSLMAYAEGLGHSVEKIWTKPQKVFMLILVR